MGSTAQALQLALRAEIVRRSRSLLEARRLLRARLVLLLFQARRDFILRYNKRDLSKKEQR